MTQQITIELDDAVYDSLSEYIGQKNLTSFFNDIAKHYVSSNANLHHTETNVFDEFFGVLESDKSVSLEDMDKAISHEGGCL